MTANYAFCEPGGLSPTQALLFNSDFGQSRVAGLFNWWRQCKLLSRLSIRTPNAVHLWDSDCIRLQGLGRFKLSREFSFAVRVEMSTRSSCTSAVLYKCDQSAKTNEHRWAATTAANSPLLKSFNFFLLQCLLILVFIGISCVHSEKSTGLRPIELKCCWLEISHDSTAPRTRPLVLMQLKALLCLQFGDGWNARAKRECLKIL